MSADAEYVSNKVHEEFEKRVDERFSDLHETLQSHSETIKAVNGMAISVATLAENMKSMLQEQQSQRQEMHEIHAAVTSINVEYYDRKINEQTEWNRNMEKRMRELELKPQDSDDHEQRIRKVEDHVKSTRTNARLDALETEVAAIKAEPAENYKRIKWGVIAAIVTAAGTAIVSGIVAIIRNGGIG